MSSNVIKQVGRFWNNGGGTPDWADVGANTQRAYVANLSTDTGQYWWYRAGGRVGRNTAGTKRFRFYVTNTGTGSGSGGAGSRVPASVLKYTNEGSTGALFVGPNEGEWGWLNFTEPFLGDIAAGYAFGVASRDSGMSIGMVQAANPAISGSHNTWFYSRATDANGIPQNGYTSTENAGHMAIVMEGERNDPPNQPGVVVRSGGDTNQQPTMTAGFSDPNETLANGVAWDRLESHYHELWWGGQLRWKKLVTATSAERSARQSVIQVGVNGDTDSGLPANISIPLDTPYAYIVNHFDRGGLISVARQYDGIVLSGAAVDAPTSPATWVSSLSNPGSVVATYRNTGGLSANRIVVQLVNANGALIKESPGKTVSVAPGGALMMTWAETTFGTLAPDTLYGVKMSARATNNQWSGYSEVRWFTTNDRPTTPFISWPPENHVASTLPGLEAFTFDKAPGIAWASFELQTESGGAIGTYASAPVGNNGARYVSPAAFSSAIPGHGRYRFRVTSSDNYLTSDTSPWRYFRYAAVPSVTITSPTTSATISTAQPLVTWTTTGQVAYIVRLWMGGTMVYDTGEITSSVGQHQISSQSGWIGGERWNNGEIANVEVLVKDGTGLWGSASANDVKLQYPPIPELIITGEALSYPGIAGTHYIRITTSASSYPHQDFRGYHRRRVEVSGPGGAEIAGTSITLPVETNSGNLSFTDYAVHANTWYRYYQWQEVQLGADVIPSPEVSIDLMVSWYGVLLHSNADPTQPVWLKYGGPGGSWDPQVSETIIRRNVAMRGKRAALAVVSGHRELTASGEHTFITTEAMSAAEQLARLYRINDWQYKHLAPNGRPNGICRRDGRGGPRGVMYATMNISGTPFHQAETVNLDFEEYDYDPYAGVR